MASDAEIALKFWTDPSGGRWYGCHRCRLYPHIGLLAYARMEDLLQHVREHERRMP